MNFDNKLIVHVACELVILAGIFFWFNRKINAISQPIMEMQQKITEYEERMQQYEQILMQHEQLFRALTGGQSMQNNVSMQNVPHMQNVSMQQRNIQQNVPMQQSVPQQHNLPVQQHVQRGGFMGVPQNVPTQQHPAPKRPKTKKPKRKKQPAVNLDDELFEDLQGLNGSPDNVEELIIEQNECDGDMCPLN